MPRKAKHHIDDEELDRQSFPPPPYESVYPQGPPKRFSNASTVSVLSNSDVGHQNDTITAATNDNQKKNIVDELESGSSISSGPSPPATPPTRPNRSSRVIISEQPRAAGGGNVRNSTSEHPRLTRVVRGTNTAITENTSRYRRTISAREEDQLCCCFACCALCCGQCMSILNGC